MSDAEQHVSTPLGDRTIFRLDSIGNTDSVPYSIKVLLESVLRNQDGVIFTEDDITNLVNYDATDVGETEVPFMPGRVVLQDFTGVPAVVDLAAMRSAIVRMTGNEADAQKVNPLVPCDLVVDHSVQVDVFNSSLALKINSRLEFERNNERYEFLKWGQSAFDNFRVVPPATGIVHQVNLEYLAKVVWDNGEHLYPDSLVGTDSHTTMINGLGVVGWGVGGIEAEAVMVGQPIYMLIPEVVGFELSGKLSNGATATDAVLRITEMLRAHGVVGKFVEFFGPGLADMPVANRATIANMAPEYGATMGFFPVDEQTTKYLRQTGRSPELIDAVEWYYKEQGLWRDDSVKKTYTSTLSLNLTEVVPALAGPKRPQDRIDLSAMRTQWHTDLSETFSRSEDSPQADVVYEGSEFSLGDGDVVIAAITSCTNTSNPDVMIGAGLVAKKAAALGLRRKPWVKTSLAPGSKVVQDYLIKAGLLNHLESLGFHIVGFGCTTCIGNSGPLPDEIAAGIEQADLVATSVLSGNRNFEGRISPHVKANYLASPPLVVAYALAGTVDIDLTTDPLGQDTAGNDVFLRDIWPSQAEIDDLVSTSVTTEQFTTEYGSVFEGSEEWQAVETTESALYEWSDLSTYIQEPPFFTNLTTEISPIAPITGARVLVKVGDSVTTDHISPAGAISEASPAGEYLAEHGIPKSSFNSYGSRRGNDQVMTRGTFANIRLRNQLAPGTEGGWTTDFTDGTVKSIYEASLSYATLDTPLVVLAGNDYGMGSSRDWAAKGTYLLGVRAVIAESYERIHRSNLIGMGVLPLAYLDGESANTLNFDGTEIFEIIIDDNLRARDIVEVTATKSDGMTATFETLCRLDTPVEVDYYRNGGILNTVLRRMAQS
jgi:aconitate hydratase